MLVECLVDEFYWKITKVPRKKLNHGLLIVLITIYHYFFSTTIWSLFGIVDRYFSNISVAALILSISFCSEEIGLFRKIFEEVATLDSVAERLSNAAEFFRSDTDSVGRVMCLVDETHSVVNKRRSNFSPVFVFLAAF